MTTYSLHPGVILTEIQRHIPGYNVPVVRGLLKGLTWLFLKVGYLSSGNLFGQSEGFISSLDVKNFIF